MTVITEEGEKLLVTTHAANPIGKFKPKEHYIDWVLKGLKQWKLPEDCIEQWKAYKASLTHSPGHQLPIHSFEVTMPKPKHHILVCTNARPPGP